MLKKKKFGNQQKELPSPILFFFQVNISLIEKYLQIPYLLLNCKSVHLVCKSCFIFTFRFTNDFSQLCFLWYHAFSRYLNSSKFPKEVVSAASKGNAYGYIFSSLCCVYLYFDWDSSHHLRSHSHGLFSSGITNDHPSVSDVDNNVTKAMVIFSGATLPDRGLKSVMSSVSSRLAPHLVLSAPKYASSITFDYE